MATSWRSSRVASITPSATVAMTDRVKQLRAEGVNVVNLPAPDIAWVAWLGAAVDPDTAPARPYYLRAPDAKPPRDPLRNATQPFPS